MTLRQAINLLEARLAGEDFPEELINDALRLTGDLEPIEWPMNKAVPLPTYKEVA
ncbi:hypothetical protein [Rhodoferax koreensis]|uniref:hypothetical protein n=1 Tax=Rhodoferax koreensis TaxID=1842727 RepID=UPI0012FFC3EA|nr:hypothetical protein [Rhodoferax koreense]